MINHKRGLSRQTRVAVSLGDDVRGRVGDAEVQNLALRDEVMQSVHDLFDARLIVPPMYVKDVNIICAKLLE